MTVTSRFTFKSLYFPGQTEDTLLRVSPRFRVERSNREDPGVQVPPLWARPLSAWGVGRPGPAMTLTLAMPARFKALLPLLLAAEAEGKKGLVTAGWNTAPVQAAWLNDDSNKAQCPRPSPSQPRLILLPRLEMESVFIPTPEYHTNTVSVNHMEKLHKVGGPWATRHPLFNFCSLPTNPPNQCNDSAAAAETHHFFCGILSLKYKTTNTLSKRF